MLNFGLGERVAEFFSGGGKLLIFILGGKVADFFLLLGMENIGDFRSGGRHVFGFVFFRNDGKIMCFFRLVDGQNC